MSPGTLSRRDFAVGAAGAALGGSVVAGAFWAASFPRESNSYQSRFDESGHSLSAPKFPYNLIQNWIKCWPWPTPSASRDNFVGIKESMMKSRATENTYCVAGAGLQTDTQILDSFAKVSSIGDSADDCSGAEGCDDTLCDSVSRPEREEDTLKGCVGLPVTRTIFNGDVKADVFNPSKRNGYLSWDDYFMAIAFLSAQRSKDPNRQVGACIVSQDQVILGIGYNGFPRGCSDDELPWSKMSTDGDPLKTKYPYVCHAEVNAILNRNHASAAGQRLYVTMFPCNECAKVIIQARIAEVAYFTDKGQGQRKDRQESSFVASQKLLAMAGVKVWQYKPIKQALLLMYR